MTQKNVVVVGAGVIGLTTALLLSQDHEKNKITLIAKHMPGDYDIEYTSPWAGGNYQPMAFGGTKEAAMEKETWPELNRLASSVPEAGIHHQKCMAYSRKNGRVDYMGGLTAKEPWYQSIFPDFKVLSKEELPQGIDAGHTFKSVCINTAIYLPYLVSQCLKNGVIMKRGDLEHISEAAGVHHTRKKANVIVNCTGLASRKLGGVMDTTVVPVRGQIVVVRNSPGMMCSLSGCDGLEGDVCYVMERAAGTFARYLAQVPIKIVNLSLGGGTVLGGTYQVNNWESQPDQNCAIRIMKRCVEICPTLTNGKGIEALSIIRHGVGLRPKREDGPRLESEIIDGCKVVHNYGHAGYGYQTSYGYAQEAMKLVAED